MLINVEDDTKDKRQQTKDIDIDTGNKTTDKKTTDKQTTDNNRQSTTDNVQKTTENIQRTTEAYLSLP